MLITLPVVYGIDYSVKGNPVRQIAASRPQREGVLAPFTRGRLSGFAFQPGVVDEEVLIVPPEARRLPDGYQRILRSTVDPNAQALDLSSGTWLRHPLRHVEEGQVDHERQIAECLESWIEAFSYVQEDPQSQIVGLRNPQLGALRGNSRNRFVRTGPRDHQSPRENAGCSNSAARAARLDRCPDTLQLGLGALRRDLVARPESSLHQWLDKCRGVQGPGKGGCGGSGYAHQGQ